MSARCKEQTFATNPDSNLEIFSTAFQHNVLVQFLDMRNNTANAKNKISVFSVQRGGCVKR